MGERQAIQPRALPTELAECARQARRTRARGSQWPLALAASLAVVSLAVALYWSVVQQRALSGGDCASHGASQAAQASRRWHSGLRRMPTTWRRMPLWSAPSMNRLKLLAPATRARVQADLEIIRRANEDLRSALAHDPASPLLLQLLHSTWQQEIDLYTSVAQSTEPLLMRRT